MSEELRNIKREIASTRMRLHDDTLESDERDELIKKEELLQYKLKESRMNKLLYRVEESNNEKHKRRWKIK